MSLGLSNNFLLGGNNSNNISSIQQKVSDCQAKVESSSQVVTEKSNTLNTLNSDTTQLSSELSTKQSAVSSAQSLLESANSLLASAQSIPVETIKDEEGNTTQDSSARDSAIAQAQQAISEANAQLAAAKAAYEQTQSRLQQKEQETAQAQSELNSANSEKSSAESALASAQSELTAAEQSQNNNKNNNTLSDNKDDDVKNNPFSANKDENPYSTTTRTYIDEDGSIVVETVTDDDDSDEEIDINGEIDKIFNQNDLGDCGLLSSINALASTVKGAEDIKNSIETTTDENGNTVYNVTFAGVNETYTVSEDEIKNAKSSADGRQYSTGDDDMTLMELAVEKCLSGSDDEFIEDCYNRDSSSSEEFGASETEDDRDYLHGVDPNIVSYLFSGDVGARVSVSEENSKAIINDLLQSGSINSAEALTLKDVDGNEFDLKANTDYKIVSQNADGTVEIEEPGFLFFNGKTHTVSIDELYNSDYSCLKSTDDSLKSSVDEMLDNFDPNGDTAIVFANMELDADGNVTSSEVKDMNGEVIDLPQQHAYSVTAVTEDTVTISNPWDTSEELTFNRDELYKLDNFKFYEIAA